MTTDIEAAIEAVEYERRTGVPMKPEFWEAVIAAARRSEQERADLNLHYSSLYEAEKEAREQAEATVREQDALIHDLYKRSQRKTIMSDHYVHKCSECGVIISQCRCPGWNGPKRETFGVCLACRDAAHGGVQGRDDTESACANLEADWPHGNMPDSLRTVIAAARESDWARRHGENTREYKELKQQLAAERKFHAAEIASWQYEFEKLGIALRCTEKRCEQAEAKLRTVQSVAAAYRGAMEAHIAELEAALRPFARFAEQWDAKPIGGIDDEFYAIHTGTEWESSLRLSDCRKARAALAEDDHE